MISRQQSRVRKDQRMNLLTARIGHSKIRVGIMTKMYEQSSNQGSQRTSDSDQRFVIILRICTSAYPFTTCKKFFKYLGRRKHPSLHSNLQPSLLQSIITKEASDCIETHKEETCLQFSPVHSCIYAQYVRATINYQLTNSTH